MAPYVGVEEDIGEGKGRVGKVRGEGKGRRRWGIFGILHIYGGFFLRKNK